MKTGTEAQQDGLYSSECCMVESNFSNDQTFTRCPKCSCLTVWELVELDISKAA